MPLRASASLWKQASELRPKEAPRGSVALPVPFVLPGESLSKYGGPREGLRTAQETAAPPKPAYTSKPSTMIEAPLEWDGSGLLPGESISKHRERRPEPVEATVEAGAAAEIATGIGEVQEISGVREGAQEETETFATEAGESTPPALHEFVESVPAEFALECKDSLIEEQFEPQLSEESEENVVAHDETEDDEMEEEELHAPSRETAAGASAEAEPEPDASASHNIDSAPPTGFRLFDLLSGKKKKEEEEPGPGSRLPLSWPSMSR